MKKVFIFLLFNIMLTSCGEQPQADFTWTPINPKSGEKVQFTNTSTNGKKYDWNLGNIKVSKEMNPTNIYENPGDYIIDLSVRNGAKSDVKTINLTVSP